MWDLIAPTEDGRTKELQNHLGEGLFKLNLPDFILTDWTKWELGNLIYNCTYHFLLLLLPLGLSAPVPRGRKGKKMKTQSSSFDIHKAEWLRKHNPEHMLQDDGYKKHLKHHCNK